MTAALRSRAEVVTATRKGWRWEAEMHEVTRTSRDAGEPSGVGEAAAEQYSRWLRPPAS